VIDIIQRQSDFESRFDVVKKTFDMQGSGVGPSTIKGLLTKEAGDMTRTEEVTTPAVEPRDMGPAEKGIMTEGTPERTETITTKIPRTTADSAMSEFFITKSGTRREELLFDKDDLSKMNVLRRIISPMGTMDAIEFINSKLKETKSNADFFSSMNKPA